MTQIINVIIGGAQKAGTSSLYYYLRQHPEVWGHVTPEFSFFVASSYESKSFHDAFRECFAGGRQGKEIVLAKSATLLHSPRGLERMQHHNPEVALVFVLRNPVDRAYSAFWYAKRQGWEPAGSFEEALRGGPSRFEEPRLRRNCAYLENGRYIEQLDRVSGLFGEEQMVLYPTEDLRHDPIGVCREIFSRLGVDADQEVDTSERLNARAMPRSRRVQMFVRRPPASVRWMTKLLPSKMRWSLKRKVERLNDRRISSIPMAAETRRFLEEYYADTITGVRKLLGRGNLWRRPDEPGRVGL